MFSLPMKISRSFSPAAREAAVVARQAKAAKPDCFGVPELFVVRTGAQAFTWELRRFGGVVLQRGSESFESSDVARAAGKRALELLCASPDLPAFKRQNRPERHHA